MISSVGDLIAFSLRSAGILGVGQTALAEDANTGLQLLRNLMAEWQRKRWLVPSLIDMPITSTGAAFYTIGPVRPTKLHAAYARMNAGDSLPVDLALAIIASREDYSAITLKSLSTFPAVAWLDTAWPTGRIYVWPIPAAGQFELHFVFPEALPTWSQLTDAIDLPPEYLSALTYALAVELAMNYGLDPKPSLVARMRVALNVVRTANLQPSVAGMPPGLPGRRGGSAVAAGSSPSFQSGGIW